MYNCIYNCIFYQLTCGQCPNGIYSSVRCSFALNCIFSFDILACVMTFIVQFYDSTIRSLAGSLTLDLLYPYVFGRDSLSLPLSSSLFGIVLCLISIQYYHDISPPILPSISPLICIDVLPPLQYDSPPLFNITLSFNITPLQYHPLQYQPP